MKEDVTKLVDNYIHCMAAVTRDRIPYPLFSTLHANALNRVPHLNIFFVDKQAEVPYALVL